MAPTTRSMQGRPSGSSQASSPQVQAGPSRRPAQQGTPQRIVGAAANKGFEVVSSDEDEDDDDEEEDGEDDDEDDDDEEEDSDEDDAGNYSDDEVDPIRTRVLKIFAMAEPNGLIKSEIIDAQIVQAQANTAS